MTPNWPLSRA